MRKSYKMKKARESMKEEVPKILRPEIHDVFHVFASKLDISSFMKLALTSKDMYKRCMEDKQIRITVDQVTLEVSSKPLKYSVYVQENSPVALQKLPCKVDVRSLEIQDSAQPEVYMGSMVQRMKDFGIKKIHELHIKDCAIEGETIIAIIKGFYVKSVNIERSIEDDLLRSILHLNLEKLAYCGPVSADFILEIETTIRELYFPVDLEVSKDELMDILSKIQSGSLCRLSVDLDAIDWDDFDMLPFDQEGPLPDERPLFFSRTGSHDPREYWFLHWNGDVTKCVHSVVNDTLEFYKCEPWELPYILRKDNDVLKDLAERRPRVSCSFNHFNTFSTSLKAFESSDSGPLPDARPLYFIVPDEYFWMLDENDNLMECKWDDGCATWKSFDPSNFIQLEDPALTTYMYWKLLKEGEECDDFQLNFKPEELFKDFETLDFEYSGDLPKERPLIFRHPEAHPGVGNADRIVLFEDRLVECSFTHYNSASIHLCDIWNRPPILITAKDVTELLKTRDGWIDDVNIEFNVFRDSLQLLKTSILVLQNLLLIWETSKTEFYILQGAAKKAVWKEGRLSISKDEDAPTSLFFRFFVANAEDCDFSLTMELEEFQSCLEQFTIVPFDYCGPLTNNTPMVFLKDVIRHSCRKGVRRRPRCNCSEVSSVLVWFLWNGTRLTNSSWGKEEPKKVLFETLASNNMEVPAMMKSKEFLKTLLQTKYNDESSRFQWFGSVDNFLTNLKNYMKLPFDYDGPLPEERPLLFEPYGRPFDPDDSKEEENLFYFLLREDGTVIQCEFFEYYVSLSLPSLSYDDLPPSLASMI